MTKVMCFGTFDLLHVGHLDYFRQAKQHGDYLIVVIARDSTKETQGKEVTFTEDERLELIKSLRIVDEAVLGNKEDHFKVIRDVGPDVIFLGYDHPAVELEGFKILRGKPYNVDVHKSSELRRKILGATGHTNFKAK
ncbi:adenylyltransferase/cytidyltransferase family protein [Candidatus Woesearchaeota archaeon]|jgi:FAD synthetase|nr:adenylyltransferase/cytidyltransferase family protein [Candidatus Woesearchaeota archaeon]